MADKSAPVKGSLITTECLAPSCTTTERDNLEALNGMILYNTSTRVFNFYENGVWVLK